MLPEHTHLALAAAFWLIVHIGIAGTPLRGKLIAAIGEKAFRGLFSLLSAVGLGLLIWAYGRASRPETFYGLWVTEPWMYWVPFLVMPVALLFFVGSVTTPNPTAVGAEKVLKDADAARGLLRVTRHPMLWSFALWAASHQIANGDVAAQILCGTILLTALAGMPSIDHKRAALDPAGWSAYAAKTSIIPFVAIAQGRNRLDLGEIGLWRVAIALAAWIGIIAAHPLAIGVSALPF